MALDAFIYSDKEYETNFLEAILYVLANFSVKGIWTIIRILSKRDEDLYRAITKMLNDLKNELQE